MNQNKQIGIDRTGRVRSIFSPRNLFIVLLFWGITSCANYYQKHWDFNQEFERGDLYQALETLEKNDKEGQSKSRFIYDVNNGLLLSILGKYDESNAYFEKAFLFGEDYRINYLDEAASYLTNPTFTMYRGEDHEHLMLLYFKAINYLKICIGSLKYRANLRFGIELMAPNFNLKLSG